METSPNFGTGLVREIQACGSVEEAHHAHSGQACQLLREKDWTPTWPWAFFGGFKGNNEENHHVSRKKTHPDVPKRETLR